MKYSLILLSLLSFFGTSLAAQESVSGYQLTCPSIYYNQCETEKCKACAEDEQCRLYYERDFGTEYNDCHAMSAMQSVEVETALNRCKADSSMDNFRCYEEFMATTTRDVEWNFNERFPLSVDARHAQAVEELTKNCAAENNEAIDTFNCMRKEMSDQGIPTWTFMNDVYLRQNQVDYARTLAFSEFGCHQNPNSEECQCFMTIPSACSPAVSSNNFYQNLRNSQQRFGRSATENREAAFEGLCRPSGGSDPSADDFATAIRRLGASGFAPCSLLPNDGECPRTHSTEGLIEFVKEQCFGFEHSPHSYCTQIQYNLTRRYCRGYCEDAKKGLRFEGSSEAIAEYDECEGILSPPPTGEPLDIRSVAYQCREGSLSENERQTACLKFSGIESVAQVLDEDLMDSLMNVNVVGVFEMIRAQTISDQVKKYNEKFGEEVDLNSIPGCSEYSDSIVKANGESQQLREDVIDGWDKVNQLLKTSSQMDAAAQYIEKHRGCFEPSFFRSCSDECIDSEGEFCPTYNEKREEFLSARRVIVRGLLENNELSTGVDGFDEDLYQDFLKVNSRADTGFKKVLRETPQYERRRERLDTQIDYNRNRKRYGDLRAAILRRDRLEKIEESYADKVKTLNTRGCDTDPNNPMRKMCDNLHKKTFEELLPEAKANFRKSIERTCLPEDDGGVPYKELAYMRPQAHEVLSEVYDDDPYLSDYGRCENLHQDRLGFYRQFCCIHNAAINTDKLMSDFYGGLNLACSVASVGTLVVPPVGVATNLTCLGLKASTVVMSTSDAKEQDSALRSQSLAGGIDDEAFLRSYEYQRVSAGLAQEATTDAAFTLFGGGLAGAAGRAGRTGSQAVGSGALGRTPSAIGGAKSGFNIFDRGRSTINTVQGVNNSFGEDTPE